MNINIVWVARLWLFPLPLVNVAKYYIKDDKERVIIL